MKKAIISTLLVLAFLVPAGALMVSTVAASENEHKGSRMNGIIKELKGFLRDDGRRNRGPGKITRIFAQESQMISGKVSSITGTSLKIIVKNRELTVNTDANTAFVNRVWDRINFSDIKVNDQIKLPAVLTDTTIQAKIIRDVSQPVVQERTIVGKVISVSNGVLKITAEAKEFSVNPAANALIADRAWNKINLADLKTGDIVQIFGGVGDATISAKLIRDLSMPPVIFDAAIRIDDIEDED